MGQGEVLSFGTLTHPNLRDQGGGIYGLGTP